MTAEGIWRATGWTCDSKPKCGADDIAIHLCMEKYGVVAKYKSKEHDA